VGANALRLSRGTFYLAQLGTFHLAATPNMFRLLPGADSVIVAECLVYPIRWRLTAGAGFIRFASRSRL
jgi:hypothetical protein